MNPGNPSLSESPSNTNNGAQPTKLKNIKIHKLVDTEGYRQWTQEHPKPSPDELAESVRRFFEYQPDMTMEEI